MPNRPRPHFGPDDEDAFFAARDALVADYETAIERRPASHPDASPFVAARMLDFKWGYGDGRLDTWRTADLEGFLLDYVPRKILVPEEEILRVVPAAGDFLAFLAERGLLTGDRLPILVDSLDDLLPEFAEAMVDRRRFGPGKEIVARMLADGVDFEAPGAVERWIEAFNARPPGEQDVLLSREPQPEPESELEGLVLPAVELPERVELEAAARDSAPVARLTAFTRYVGAGRRLTKDGNLTLADGRELVPLLGTRDLVDPVIGGRQFRTRTTSELRELDLVFRWARAAGFVKVRSGRVSATERGRRLGRDPLADWGATFEAYFRADPFGIRPPRQGPFWGELLAELLDQLPLLLSIGSEPVEVQQLSQDVWDALEEGYDLERLQLPRESLRQFIDDDIDERVVAPLVELGAFQREGDRVSLTDLGRWGANRLLRRRGHVAPIVGEFANAPVEDLLRACSEMRLEDAERELERWIEGHSETAARELARAARSAPLTTLAMRGLELLGPSGEAEVRGLLDDEAVAPYARLWLVEHGLERRESVPPDTLTRALIDQLTRYADEAGPLKTVAQIATMDRDATGQLRLVEELRAAADPRARDLLAMIAHYHPLAAVRAAAERAAKGRRPGLH